jgi:pilus assembly protein CpaE
MNIGKSQPSARVVVVDMVLPIGSIASIVGYEGEQNIVTVADIPAAEATPGFLKEKLVNLNIWRFHLLAGSPDPESSLHLKTTRIVDIISMLRDVYDYVLVDIGRSLSKISLPLIKNADLNVLVVSSDISAVSLTKNVWKYMQDKGIGASSLYTILNRAAGMEGLSKGDAEKLLSIPIRTTIPYLGSNMSFANSQSQPYTLKFPKDTASIVFLETAKEMTALAHTLRAESN